MLNFAMFITPENISNYINVNNILIIEVIILIIIIIMVMSQRESWKVYQEIPYGNYQLLSSDHSFYRRDRYRKPYRWPVKFHSDHPVPHQRHFS